MDRAVEDKNLERLLDAHLKLYQELLTCTVELRSALEGKQMAYCRELAWQCKQITDRIRAMPFDLGNLNFNGDFSKQEHVREMVMRLLGLIEQIQKLHTDSLEQAQQGVEEIRGKMVDLQRCREMRDSYLSERLRSGGQLINKIG